jgi:RNA polymerase sigma factor (sigma-70 family)
MPDHALFTTHLPTIEWAIGQVCRRKCLRGEEAEDFASSVRLKLLEDDCAVLRKFKGVSKISTYLVTVVLHLFQDYRIAKWGKWRPSAEARRVGTVAVQLETLTVRDGLGFEQAVETLRRNFGVTESAVELAEIAGRLPSRLPSRRFEGEEALERVPAPAAADERLHDGERVEAAARVAAALREALAALPPEDRLLLTMRYEDGFQVSRLSTVLGRPQRQLYSQCDRLARELRKALEARGVTAAQVADVEGWERMDAAPASSGAGRKASRSSPSSTRGRT